MPVDSFDIEEVARFPGPGMAVPGSFSFSPDDRLLTFLFSGEGSLTRQLYALDVDTGEQRLLLAAPDGGVHEEALSLEEQLRRERQRQLALGVTNYAWAEQRRRLMVALPGGLSIADPPDAPLRQALDTSAAPALDPQLAPDGQWIAYAQAGELFVVSAEGGEPRQLTFGAAETGRTHGLAEFVAQEEMDRQHGFWWSPDSATLAFAEVDETHLPVYRIVHQGKDAVGEGAQEDHRYPFAGQANARVRLGVVARTGGDPVWMDLGGADATLPTAEHEYLARVDWRPDGRLAAQLVNRLQSRLDLVCFDPATGQRDLVLSETSDVWINLHDLYRPLQQGGFLWASERSGFRHLLLCDGSGEVVRPLTEGEWMVEELAGVDEAQRLVYFTATAESPLERHLYAVSLDGGAPRRITRAPGMHAVTLDHGCRRFVDVYDAVDRPPTVSLCSLADGAVAHVVHHRRDPRIDALGLQPPELVALRNRHGDLLYGAVYRPPASFGPGPYPTVVSVYGGPHKQMVTNSWVMTQAMRAQHLRSRGFLVFVLDNRGSARRGLAFEGAIKHDMGHAEVEDQVDGVRWLVEQGLADPARVGITGWSYGGYMAAMALARAPETFRVAVAGAPVSHWDGYDTFYTERYMGTPQSNPEGYASSAVMAHVSGIAGRLLLVHGLIDENVHFRHTARLINALIRARVPYELMLFPDERHMPRRLEDRVFMEERIRDFLLETL